MSENHTPGPPGGSWLTIVFAILAILFATLAVVQCADKDPDDGTQVERSARRVDRLSFFNVAGGVPNVEELRAEITLYKSPDLIPDNEWATGEMQWPISLPALRGMSNGRIIGREFGSEPPLVARCVVEIPGGGDLTCDIIAPEAEFGIVSATFWCAESVPGGALKLCGEIVTSNGLVKTNE